MSAGGWYRTHTEIARKVSEHLGLQGRAVYDELCARVDNQSSETWVDPATIAKVFGITATHVRRILCRLREMNAVHCLLKGNARVYRVNRTKPEIVCALNTESNSEHIGSEVREMSEHIGSEVRESEPASISYLDSKSKTSTSQGVMVSPEIIPPSPDDFDSDSAAAQTLMLPLGVSGMAWLDTLTGSVKVVTAQRNTSRRDACDFLLSQWALYSSRHGPARKKFFFQDGDFMNEQETHGGQAEQFTGGTALRNNAHLARTANNLSAAQRAIQYLDDMEQTTGDNRGPH